MQVAPLQARRRDADLLIAEARARQRRRRRALAAVLLVLAAAGVLIGWALSGHDAPAQHPSVGSPAHASRSGHAARMSLHAPSQPGSLAVGAHGVLYIADDTANAIFARHPNGRFTVVAGTGRAGFSGDGHLAVHARLNDPAGMTYDRATRTLYVADSGNNRIRAINAAGIIRTVVGGGPPRRLWVASGTRARHASLLSPAAVTISPTGQLYIADEGESEVLRLNPSGTLTRIAGLRHFAGVKGIGRPATAASADGADGLAFDRHGDLYLTGFSNKSLLAITPDGRMREIWANSIYPRGAGGIVRAADGTVIVIGTQQVYRYTSLRARHTLIDFARTGRVGGIRAIAPTGLAISRRGTIYLDTRSNDGYTNAASILTITQNTQHVHVLWKRPPKA